jgi:hypothetical protein
MAIAPHIGEPVIPFDDGDQFLGEVWVKQRGQRLLRPLIPRRSGPAYSCYFKQIAKAVVLPRP